VHLFRDVINQASSLTGYFLDYRLFPDLSPWDFAEITPFNPAYLEGDVKIMSATAQIVSKVRLMSDQFDAVVPALRAAYGQSDIEPLWQRLHIRSSVNVALPIYYLDKQDKGPKVRFTVNGQTGQVSCVGRGQSHGRSTLVREPARENFPQSDDVALYSPYVPVVKVRGKNDLFCAERFERALKKHGPVRKIKSIFRRS
jgi:hypothetical protein